MVFLSECLFLLPAKANEAQNTAPIMASGTKKHEFDFNSDYDNVHFASVGTTDYYRKGNPYKIFRIPGQSNVVIEFNLLKSEAEGMNKVTISLNHCSTSAEGVVDIFYNDVEVLHQYLSPKWNFGKEEFHFDKGFVEGKNTIKILLNDTSPGVYWLSDALISVTLKTPKTLKDQTGEFIVDHEVAYGEDELPKNLNSYLKSIDN